MDNAKTSKKLTGITRTSGAWPVLSLFSGAGGLDLGFKDAGFHPVLAIDINRAAIATYKHNHPDSKAVSMDLATVDPADILDLWVDCAGGVKPIGIVGGPPCQAFSSSNVHQVEDDPRRRLLDNYAKIVEVFTARYGIHFFALENVPGLLNNKHRLIFEKFKGTSKAAGFEVSEAVLDAGTFGVPQHRKRLVVVGINRERHPGITLDILEGKHQPPPSIQEILKGLPDPAFCAKHLQTEDIPHHPNHVAMVPRSVKFTDGSLSPGNCKGLSFKVLAWDAPSYTVAYGHNEIHVHPDCSRRLSIYEAMRLQGFPHSYQLAGTFTEQVRLVSDAVPPPLAEGIANMIAEALGYKQTLL